MSRLRSSTEPQFVLRKLLAVGMGFGINACLGTTGLLAQDVRQEVQLTTIPGAGDAAPVVSAAPMTGIQEPLKVQPLGIPNTSLAGIGTAQLPTDSTLGRLPVPIPLPFGPDRDTGWTYSNKPWVAPVFCHQPTYYEDIMLENHGHETCPPLQPILSGARFYTGIFCTPYLYCLNGPFEDVPSVGRYRPGTTAPALRQRAPYDPYALGVQAVSTASGVSLLTH